jgi:DNA-binding transcriptional LysR family regulator
LAQLQTALAPADFSPATSDRRFVLAAGAYAATVLAPPIVRRVADEAANVELVIQTATLETMDRLDAHRVDFVIGGGAFAPARLVREAIAEESLAWLVRSGHPLASKDRVEVDDLVRWPHVVISSGLTGADDEGQERRGLVTRASWEDAGAFETALAARGLTRRVAVIVPDAYSAISVVAYSDMVTLMPRRLAQVSAQGGRLRLIEPPYPSPSVSISLLYLKERLADPAVAWMREVIRSTAADI